MNVQATQCGFYGQYRNVGDIFDLTDDSHFASNWMVDTSIHESAFVVAPPEEIFHFLQKDVEDSATVAEVVA